ncbi:helix-turn-helix transcriptional regulator [Paenibacillus sp. LHD-117]|uniref:helix-turn-helix transcriptional regulator n=1 Tax=Paenibacillus sp. LHD-117 TaxID=3071412 RepID=UPI0027E069CF|nr:helix-turn-helix transcriptional regulator [Paenibacillus sp. LHD-117]MDQ6417961.1 helix-turn-helix transcriptional regulator [Paenibacillus sp. LHD-117]
MNNILFELPPLPYYITIGQTCYEPGQQHPNRRNIGIFDLLFVIQGTLFMGEDEKHWSVGPGQSLLLHPDRYHYSTSPCSEKTVFYWIHFEYQGTYHELSESHNTLPIRHAWANPYRLKVPQHSTPRQFESVLHLLSLMHDQASANGSTAYWKEQQRFIDLIQLLEDERSENATPSSVMRLAEQTEAYLRQHFQQDITNETLSDALHFHPNYIVRCMKEIYRCTPMDYLLQYRLEQAKLLLIKTEWPVSRIGEQVGFRYAPYFSSRFKRHTGLTPLTFRKLYSR